jgi:hypothetical protein
MKAARVLAEGATLAGGAAALAALSYAAYVGRTWRDYGRPHAATTLPDIVLDRFMPAFEVVERHEVHVRAPAEMTLAAAREQELEDVPVVRALFRARETVLGAPHHVAVRQGLLKECLALGWGVLAEVDDREIVVGAVTRPWERNIVFRAVPADAFASFCEPGYVKIAWTLRADPVGEQESIFRTETRVSTTDPVAREKFRLYWSFFSPGIALIRRLMLQPLRAEAERRAMAATLSAY